MVNTLFFQEPINFELKLAVFKILRIFSITCSSV